MQTLALLARLPGLPEGENLVPLIVSEKELRVFLAFHLVVSLELNCCVT
jgi:hypothetical protein